MPVLSSTVPIDILLDRSVTTTNSSSSAVKVVCAWPVSGQYGPGTRFLYYALISACIFGRGVEWLKAACLAAALLFPAVAALHGIVLASVHVDDAVDMDVFGAFQVCSIGILLAPVTVMISRSYFEPAGSSIIILWTALILAGLMSLTVEFFRTNTSPCTPDHAGNPIPTSIHNFPYGTTCGLVCSVDKGPYSPMRGGSANNIYVIPAPDKLTFRAGTLLAAACCVPALLLLISNWNKIREINRRKKNTESNRHTEAQAGLAVDNTSNEGSHTREDAEDANDQCTCYEDEDENTHDRRTRHVAIPIFGAIILAILTVGEVNFFSPQVRYQTEPIASIGQWAPIVGTWLALLGSFYMLLAKDFISEKRKQGEMGSSTKPENSRAPTEPVPPSVTSPVKVSCATCGRTSVLNIQSHKRQSRGQKFLDSLTEWRLQGVRKMIKVIDFISIADAKESSATQLSRETWIHYPGEKRKNPALGDTMERHRRLTREISRSTSPSRSASVGPRHGQETDAIRSIQPPDSPSSARSPSDLAQLESAITFSESTSSRDRRSSGAPPRRVTSDTLQLPLSQSPVERTFTMDSLPLRSPPLTFIRGRQGRPSIVVTDDGDALPSQRTRISRRDTLPFSLATISSQWPFRRRTDTV